jgi:hypothetical protein
MKLSQSDQELILSNLSEIQMKHDSEPGNAKLYLAIDIEHGPVTVLWHSSISEDGWSAIKSYNWGEAWSGWRGWNIHGQMQLKELISKLKHTLDSATISKIVETIKKFKPRDSRGWGFQ